MTRVAIETITLELAHNLPPRVQDVVKLRFGLGKEEPSTLEAIGRKHGITRERTRQIVQEGLRLLRADVEKSRQRQVLSLLEQFRRILQHAGFLKREDLLLELFKVRHEANHALFLLTLDERFHSQRETQDFHAFWSLRKDMVEQAHPIHKDLLSFFEKKAAPLPQERVVKDLGRSALPYLEVSKHLMQGYDGRWGLRNWPEVNPRGMREKAYLVLKDRRRPLHFTEVAQAIALLQEKLEHAKLKPVLPQTVHNELIKDPRFVLVGRGTYGLREWGVNPGTVKEVLRAILKRNGKAMSKEELMGHILGERNVKESTVLLNLKDQRYFTRRPDGTWSVLK